MKKIALLLVAVGIVLLVIALYPQNVEKPVKDGSGPLAISIDPQFPAPEYHTPLEQWQLNHKNVINNGNLERNDCLACHEPVRSCNNCHNYVGVDEIIETPREWKP